MRYFGLLTCDQKLPEMRDQELLELEDQKLEKQGIKMKLCNMRIFQKGIKNFDAFDDFRFLAF